MSAVIQYTLYSHTPQAQLTFPQAHTHPHTHTHTHTHLDLNINLNQT